jgi:hypothetical protein
VCVKDLVKHVKDYNRCVVVRSTVVSCPIQEEGNGH